MMKAKIATADQNTQSQNQRLTRRGFIAASASTLALAACSSEPEPGRYTQSDKDLLAAQRLAETQNAGNGIYGPQNYKGYRGLAKLPWFELDQHGSLQCVDQSIPLAIDAHCHLGMSVLFEPRLDLSKQTERTAHLLDCDKQTPGCDLDLDVYANQNFTDKALDELELNMLTQGLWGSATNRSQTIPNLLREMDAMRVESAVLLPIKLGLPFGDNLTESWRTAVEAQGASDRLLSGFSVHPDDEDRISKIRQYAKQGFKVMKLHPPVQRFYPDDAAMMDVYEVAQELGVTIFFHGGRAGIEPESSHRYAMPRHYEAPLREFPRLNFILGHAGARDFAGMSALAFRYDNAWLGVHGQSVSNLEQLIEKSGGERLLFGTDWPFYHIANSLAKVLICTQGAGRASIRHAILRGNAERLFGLS
jgi:predicted TIM-barrel fold metal-dependent hydrolase